MILSAWRMWLSQLKRFVSSNGRSRSRKRPRGTCKPFLEGLEDRTLLSFASAVDHFVVAAPGTVQLGTPLTVNVRAVDSSGNVVQSSPPQDGLIDWWQGDDNAGDIAGNNSGTLVNGAGFGPGKIGDAFLLNGSNQYVQVPQSNQWDFGSQDFAIDLWVNLNSVPSSTIGEPGDIFVAHDVASGGHAKWFFALGGDILNFHINSEANQDGPALFLAQTPFAPKLHEWYHLAVTRSAGTFTIYVNGAPGSSEFSTSSIPAINAPLTIGEGEGKAFVDGLIDEVHIYNRALSPSEIQAMVAGTIHFSSSDTHAGLPADYTFTPDDNGTHTFTVTLNSIGSQDITVSDVAIPTITGSASVIVQARLTATGTTLNGTEGTLFSGTVATFTDGNPDAGSLIFDSSAPETIADRNGLGTGFTDRLPGTGFDIPANDPNLDLSSNPGLLLLTSTYADINQNYFPGPTANNLGQLDAPGFYVPNVSTQDLYVSALFRDVQVPNGSDQLCLYVGMSASNVVRAGFHNGNVYLITENQGSGDQSPFVSDFDAFAPGDAVRLTFARNGGEWTLSWEDLTNPSASGSSPGVSIPWLDAEPNLYVGVLAADAGTTIPFTAHIDTFSVSTYTAGIDWGDGQTSAGTIIANDRGGFDVQGSHTYAEEGQNIITVSISDVGGASATATSSLRVADAPLNSVGNSKTVNVTEEKQFSTVVATFHDSNSNPDVAVLSATIDWGDGSTSFGSLISTGDGNFDVEGTHSYAEQGTEHITITFSDSGGAPSVVASATAIVAEAPFTVAGTTFHPTEGLSFSGTVATMTDFEAGDTITINWGDGSPVTAGGIAGPDANGVWSVTGTHKYQDEGMHRVKVTIRDVPTANETAGTLLTANSTAIVADAPLVSVFARDLSLTEGQVFSGSVAHFVDTNPSPHLSDFTATINWGDGKSSAGSVVRNNTGGFDLKGAHRYVDESPASGFPISVTIKDRGGSNATASSFAHVADAPLKTADVARTLHVREERQFSAVLTSFHDANRLGKAGDFSASIDWGDSTTDDRFTITKNRLTGNFDVRGTHTYAENGLNHITVTVNDIGGADPVSAFATAVVAEMPFTLRSAGVIKAIEGKPLSGVTVAKLTDFEPVDLIRISWGDGTITSGTTASNPDTDGVWSVLGTHTYSAAGTHLITVTAEDTAGDDNGAILLVRTRVVVRDAPLTGLPQSLSATVGQQISMAVASFMDTDPSQRAANQYSATINWGDGSALTKALIVANTSLGGNNFTVSGSHRYHQKGHFRITVAIVDTEGGAFTTIFSQADILVSA